jgi:hypothetical protein
MRAMKALGTRDRSKYNCLLTDIKDTKKTLLSVLRSMFYILNPNWPLGAHWREAKIFGPSSFEKIQKYG